MKFAIDKDTMRAKEAGHCDLSHVPNATIIEASFPHGFDDDVHKMRDCLLLDGELVLAPIVLPGEVDQKTEMAINLSVSTYTPIGEQIGILRELLVQWGNALGLEFTAAFTRLNEIAIAEIEKAKAVKDAQDN